MLVASVVVAATVTESKAAGPLHNPDGTPDLQGVWSNATNVPLERPAEGRGGRAARTAPVPGTAADVHYDLSQYGLDRSHTKMAEDNRTSLVTTPDGRIPPRLAEAQKRAAERAAFTREHQWDGPETRPLSERCIVWPNEGPPMMSPGYNSNVQIVQGPGYVAIEQEMIHDVRIIPTDNRPHVLPASTKLFQGDSVGHWEGDTFVVDTTNLNDRTWLDSAGNVHTDQMHVVERFTMVNDRTINYEATMEDPKAFTKPWKIAFPLNRNMQPNYEQMEFACIEGNQDAEHYLESAGGKVKAK